MRPAHQQRVIVEKDDLDMKLSKLFSFKHSPLFASLEKAEQARLEEQHAAMLQYSEILGRRIAAFPE